MAWETVLLDKANGVAKITLNRPDKRNAQNEQLINELDEAFKEADNDPAVRVIVLCGAGSSFSAGHDLSVWRSAGELDPAAAAALQARRTVEGRMRREQTLFFDKCLAIRNLTKPTIAQVHGHCIAAGMMLAAMCDIVYAADDAVFSNPTLLMGASGAELLIEPWEMGPRRAKEFLFTGGRVSAQDAFRLGFVNKVVPREALDEEVTALAAKIAIAPPVAVSLTKASINRTMDRMGQMDSWHQHFLVHQVSHATKESEQLTEERQKAGSLKEQFKYQEGKPGA